MITIDYKPSEDNVTVFTDPLTKGLSRKLVEKSLRGMCLKPIA